jgi:transposase
VVWHVPTTITGKIRAVHISSGKSDKMDARALALAATWIAEGRPPRGVYPYQDATQQAAQALRSYVNAYAQAVKASTRASNQLDQLAFSIWPVLAQRKDTYLRAVAAGAVTPAQLRALAAQSDLAQVPGYAHGNARKPLLALVADLPDLACCEPAIEQTIRDTAARLSVLAGEEIAARREAERLVQSEPFAEVTRRWLTIPGVELLDCACFHVASNGRVLSYSKDEFRTACGASPKRGKSGQGDRRARGTKPGYRPLMQRTWMITTRLLHPDAPPNAVHDLFSRLKDRHHPKPFLAAISQLVNIVWGVARCPKGYHYP